MITSAKQASRYEGGLVRALLLAGVTGWLLLGLQGAQRPASAGGEMSQDQFDQRVHDYILAHPEVVMQALQSLDARQREAEAAEAKAALTSRADDIFRDKQSPVGGNAQGNVTLVEFFDYNCPYCRQVAPIMAQAVTDEWNAVHVIARGNVLTHIINGRVMTVVVDDDAPNRPVDGLIGVQVHVGPPMKVEYKNIRLKSW